MGKWIRFRRQDAQSDEFGRLVDEVDFDEQCVNVCIGDIFDKNEPTDEILKIKDLNIFSKSSYVGYTATPFANIFIDPDTNNEMIGQNKSDPASLICAINFFNKLNEN